jgi:hypothetical protein
MSRLTKRDNRKDVIIPYSPMADNLLIIDKLGQLEDIMEKYHITTVAQLDAVVGSAIKFADALLKRGMK